MGYLFLVIGVGIILSILVIILGRVMEDSWANSIVYGLAMGVLGSFFTFALCHTIDPEITDNDYFSAVGAKSIIASTDHITIDNQEMIIKSLNVINDYQKKRDKIEMKSKSKWNGSLYKPETLEEYPDVKIDSLEINKFK